MIASDAVPLFVIGPPRSGTTFFTVAINRHPQIFVTNETRIMSFLFDSVRRSRAPSPLLPSHPARASFVKLISEHAAKIVHDFYDDHVDKANLGVPIAQEQKLYRKVQVWGDKNPGYCDGAAEKGCLRFILDTFPRARFIELMRDPRSAISSYLQLRNIYNRDLEGCIEMWLAHASETEHFFQTIPENHHLTVKHEDFSTEKGLDILPAVESFVSVNHEPKPIEFLKRELLNRTPYRSPVTPIEKLGSSVFQDVLSPEQVRLIELRTQKYIEMHGYQ